MFKNQKTKNKKSPWLVSQLPIQVSYFPNQKKEKRKRTEREGEICQTCSKVWMLAKPKARPRSFQLSIPFFCFLLEISFDNSPKLNLTLLVSSLVPKFYIYLMVRYLILVFVLL